ncbi:hypothetical protein FRD01_22435 [Microvenator marinus]|uniref:Uncharacterized protein n=1 Tax=Microvenator marinus TaxID=2600177 RepID=A0A5B8Y0S6_9DELT|nr:hypothetical protein [Microvenator marinus]QED29943.1 hypothetical protein FRD01_22435 [Microvenator marinus]
MEKELGVDARERMLGGGSKLRSTKATSVRSNIFRLRSTLRVLIQRTQASVRIGSNSCIGSGPECFEALVW